MLKKYPIMCLLVLSTLFLIFVGCDQKDKKTDNSKKTHIITAALASPQYQLYFTGTLLPIKTIPVISRVEGNVTQLFFSYGEKVEKDQKLMIIDSKPLADDYRKTVNDFLQKKQAYMSGQLTYAGNKALYDAGVTSKTTYLSQKASFDNAVLNYLQAKYELEKVLKMANLDPKQIETLSIEDTTAVNAVLQKHFSHIVVVAPGSGVALFLSCLT